MMDLCHSMRSKDSSIRIDFLRSLQLLLLSLGILCQELHVESLCQCFRRVRTSKPIIGSSQGGSRLYRCPLMTDGQANLNTSFLQILIEALS